MRISLEKAHQLLLSGHVVAIPTETVYGLAASIERPAAIDEIFALKNRPPDNPLIIHMASARQIFHYAPELPLGFDALAQSFWPGPMTLVLPAETTLIPHQARAGLATAAFRVPNHSLTHALLEWVGPLVMPSANRSGRPSATRLEHVETDFGPDFPVLDGGTCGCGLESTILYWKDGRWQIVRLGVLPPESFVSVLGYLPRIITAKGSEHPLCPGQLYRHYAPKASLHLGTELGDCPGIIVGFNERIYPSAIRVYRLGSVERPMEVAENLYAVLRQLDKDDIGEAWVDMDFPLDGLWKTISERLQKASISKN